MTDPVPLQDDCTIADNEMLYRRIPRKFVHWAVAESNEPPPIPRQGFQDQPEDVARDRYGLDGPCMSVGLHVVLLERGRSPEALIEGMEGDGVVSLQAGLIRGLKGPNAEDWDHGVMPNPTVDAPWHAVVFVLGRRKRTMGMQRKLADIAQWVIIPTR